MKERRERMKVRMSRVVPQECKEMTRTKWLGCSEMLNKRIKETKNSRRDVYVNAMPERMSMEPSKTLMMRMVTKKRCHLHLALFCPSRPARMIGMNTSGRT